MTCSRKSTTWSASAAALAAGLLALAGGAIAAETRPAEEPAVRRAIVDVVKSRMGSEVDVQIDDLRVKGAAPAGGEDAALVARPEPGARLGRTIRFALSRPVAARRVVPAGYALATVFVVATHARAVRPLGRGETLAAGDVEASRADVGPLLLQRLPEAADLVGTRVLRDIVADEVITRTLVSVRPMVQSGDEVAIRAGADGVTAEIKGVADQSGDAGDTIRVRNLSSRRSLKARVVGRGKVEVIQ
jgi:flagella basal body P-ring formation protein FlgA